MIGVLVAIVFCVVIPFVVMAMLAPSLDRTAPKVGNFRGVLVYNGLGIVWFVWLISFWVGAHLLVVLHVEQPLWISYLTPLFPVLAGSCAFGLFDDWAGSNQTKGFKGHLNALAHGRLTTGGLKFLGIGFLSLFLAISLYYDGAPSILRVILVCCTVALTANLMNLFDLRPGRAQKIYFLGLVAALVLIVVFGIVKLSGWELAALALAGLGPLVAVWRFDLGERGMIGDAGANSMGAFLGFLYATALPTWMLVVAVVALTAVNLLSERVSFSKIIEANAVLSAVDAWGRRKNADGSVSASVSASVGVRPPEHQRSTGSLGHCVSEDSHASPQGPTKQGFVGGGAHPYGCFAQNDKIECEQKPMSGSTIGNETDYRKAGD